MPMPVKSLQKSLLLLGLLSGLYLPTVGGDEEKTAYGVQVMAVYQLVDDEESDAAFDFQAANRSHHCGGEKKSNHYRSYSEYQVTADRKFALVMQAMEKGYKLAFSELKCEGKRMLVGWVRISK